MASLHDLPTELLLRILDFVERYNAHHKGSFYPLMLTCKRLNDLVIPMLYRDVAFGPSRFGSNQLTSQFVHAIQASETHASMVKSYALERGYAVSGPEDMYDPDVYRAFLDRVCEKTRPAAKADLIRKAFKTRNGLHYERYPEFIASLYLPNLEVLCLEGAWTGPLEPFDAIGKPSQEEPSSDEEQRAKLDIWPKLRKVVIKGSGGKYPDDTLPLAIFARIPQVECIEASALADQEDGEDEPLWHIRPSSSGLQRLVLGPSCQLTNRNLEELLRAPKALKEFRYNIGHIWAHIEFSTTSLQRSLLHQRHSLHHLTLSHTYYENSRDYDNDIIQPMNLSALSSLRVLEISPLLVLGDLAMQHDENGIPAFHRPTAIDAVDTEATKRNLVDMLPSGGGGGSIEVLRFSRCGGDPVVCLCLSRCLQELAKCIKRHSDDVDGGDDGNQVKFANLRTVELHVHYRCADIQWDAILPGLQAVRSVGIEAGVYDGGPLSFDEVTENRWRVPERVVEPGGEGLENTSGSGSSGSSSGGGGARNSKKLNMTGVLNEIKAIFS